METIEKRHPDLKNNLEEIEKCKLSPLYFYNTYVRLPHQKILTEEEYFGQVKVWNYIKFGIRKMGEKEFLKQYPITHTESFGQNDDRSDGKI